MYDYTKPPQIPYFFKIVGIILFLSSFVSFILFYHYNYQWKIDEKIVDDVYTIIRLLLVLSTFFILFSKEKVDDERVLQFKVICMAYGLIYVILGYVAALLIKLIFNIELEFFLDPTYLIIAGSFNTIYSFYSNKKDF